MRCFVIRRGVCISAVFSYLVDVAAVCSYAEEYICVVLSYLEEYVYLLFFYLMNVMMRHCFILYLVSRCGIFKGIMSSVKRCQSTNSIQLRFIHSIYLS